MTLRRSLILVFSLAMFLLALPLAGHAYKSGVLLNESNGKRIDDTTRQLVIFIHGWNSGGWEDAYTAEDPVDRSRGWTYLKDILKLALSGTDWKLAMYHWEAEANTGFILSLEGFLVGNAGRAADRALINGKELADIVDRDAPNLRQLHLIAHSAGTWAAWVAANHLLESNPYLTIQVTLLDPFIPATVPNVSGGFFSSPLEKSLIDGFAQNSYQDRIYRLENYYAVDPWSPSNLDGTLGTDNVFSWRQRDINQQVDHTSGGNRYYDSHEGPIQFFADTVAASIDGYPFPAALTANPLYEWSQRGWFRSLAHEGPDILWQPRSQTVTTGATVTLSVTATGPLPLHYAWLRLRNGIPPVTVASAASYTFTAETDGDEYVVRVYNDNNSYVYSDKAKIEVTDFPAPSSLSAVPVSSSQVNLTWVDRSSNEYGFALERSVGTAGEWSSLIALAANVQAYSDRSVTAGPLYKYRVRAYKYINGSPLPFPSGYSNIASATTQPAAGTTHTLTINSINPSSGVTVSSYIGNSQVVFATTPTTRTFAHGALVNVLCAATASGQAFQRWQVDGVDYAFTPNTLLALTEDHTLTAVYGAAPRPIRTLSSLAIQGPSSVNERSSAQYTAVATYTDGSSAGVVADWNEDSSYATISNTGRLDASAVTSNKYVEIDATYSAGGVTRTAIADVTIVNTDAVPNYTLNLSATHGQIGRRPNMNEYPADTVVQLFSYPDDGYLFDHWSGDASGTDGSLYVTMNANKSITANFAIDTTDHGIQMFLSPQAAVDEGAGWQLFGASSWWNSGFTAWLSTSQTQTVFFKPISGWVTPDSIRVAVPGGPATVAYATYQEIKGSLQVTLTPDAARTAGARWRLDGGAWTESGVTIRDVSTGNHAVEFLPLAGWGTPPSQSISVQRNVTSILYGDYFPPAGLPIITAVSPRTGPLAGGVTVTIDGANFAPDSAVTFGGISSPAVTFVSSTQLKAVSPPRASYGTVALSVQSGGQTATQANGFSYMNARGANMDLVGQIGGDVEAVAVVGNTVYYGEGSGLVVSDFSNPASPVERGRISLPAFISDIAVANNIAFVAVGDAGLYAVDVSIPTAPAIVGFFDTTGVLGVVILGNVAYVADVHSLRVLDIKDPTAIVGLGSLSIAGGAAHVSVGVVAAKTYAFVAEDLGSPGDPALHVVDVTTPSAPVEVASIPAPGSAFKDVKIVGTTLYVSDYSAGVKIFDASDPTHLLQTGTYSQGASSVIDVSGTRLYTCGIGLRVADLTVTPNPASVGSFATGTSCYDLAVINGLAFAAMGSDGLKVVDISNPASMSLRSSIATLGGAEDVHIAGHTALVGNAEGLHTVDISNPAKPVWLASLPGKGVTHIVAANGKATLVNDGDTSVRIADVANPSAPSIVGSYTGAPAWNVALMGTNPVLAEATTDDAASLPKVEVLNISSPSAPQSAGSVLLGNPGAVASAIAVAGSWGFVGTRGVGSNTANTVEVVDLSNPASPQRTGSVPIASILRDIAASEDGGYVYAPSSLGIQVIDARNKTAPVITSIVDPPQAAASYVNYVQVLSNRLYANNGFSVFVFDITSPASPAVLGYHKLPATADGHRRC